MCETVSDLTLKWFSIECLIPYIFAAEMGESRSSNKYLSNKLCKKIRIY